MEKVLDRNALKRGCLISQNPRGLYDLTIFEDGRIVETVKGIRLKSAGIAAEASLQKAAERAKKANGSGT